MARLGNLDSFVRVEHIEEGVKETRWLIIGILFQLVASLVCLSHQEVSTLILILHRDHLWLLSLRRLVAHLWRCGSFLVHVGEVGGSERVLLHGIFPLVVSLRNQPLQCQGLPLLR